VREERRGEGGGLLQAEMEREGEKEPMRLFSISNSFSFSKICYALFEMVFEFKFEHASIQGVPPYVQQTSKQAFMQFRTYSFISKWTNLC
jgi:hypothetical protein